MSELTVTLYRPCNQAEYDLVAESGFKRWPPRLPSQPIFYPVTNLEYARLVNRWNVRDYGVGHILKFKVLRSFLDLYEVQTVGDSVCTEYWIPSEELEDLNNSIVDEIELVETSAA